jgi:uncharacterized protein (TIGR02145 family)
MAENLKSFKLNDSKPIPLIRDNKLRKKTKTSAYGWYKSDIAYPETYGAIYNWYAVATGKLCPKGWHIPTQEEWNDLMDYAGEISFSNEDNEPGTMTHWWTSTEDRLNLAPGEKATNASIVGLSYNSNAKSQGTCPKESAQPVRCKKNEE